MAAALDIWKSADGAWDNVASWESGVVPEAGDWVIFPANNTVSVTSGLDQDGILLASLITQPGYTGDIGLSGTHLQISATRVLHEGSGRLYFTDTADPGSDLIINSPNGAVISGANVGKIIVFRGNVTLDSSLSAIDALMVTYLGSQASDAVVTVQDSAGTITAVLMNGGSIDNGAQVTTLTMQSGTFTQRPSTDKVVNIYQTGGSTKYKDNTAPAGLWKILGGMLDCSEVRLTAATKLVIADLEIWPGATAILPEDLVTVTAGGKLLDHTTMGRV